MKQSIHIPRNYFKPMSLIYAAVLTAILALSGCGGIKTVQGYSGAVKPDTEIAQIIIPMDFNIQFLDGEPFTYDFFNKGIKLSLLPGKHKVVVQYVIFWDISSNDHQKIESQPIMLEFNVDAERTYTLSFDPPQTLEAATTFAARPTVQLLDETQNPVAGLQTHFQLKDQQFLASFESNETAQPPPSDSSKPVSGEATAESSAANDKALEMLKYWWQQAGQQQQAQFQEWINQ